MPFGNVNYAGSMAGSGSIGGNSGNSLMLLLQRLMAMRQRQPAASSPEGDAAMAQMLGLRGAPSGVGLGSGVMSSQDMANPRSHPSAMAAAPGVMSSMQLGWRPPGSAAGMPTPQVLAKLQAGGGGIGARGATMRQLGAGGIGLGGYR